MAHHHELCISQDLDSFHHRKSNACPSGGPPPQTVENRSLNSRSGTGRIRASEGEFSDAGLYRTGLAHQPVVPGGVGGIPRRGLFSGWLIAQKHSGPIVLEPHRRKFLQLGTGQWCPAVHATWFPNRRNAVVYVNELGLAIEEQVEIVYLRAPGGSANEG